MTSSRPPRTSRTVGHLYRSIEAGFRHLTEKYGEDWLFTGPPRAQATPAHFGWPNLLPVTGLDSACAAVEEIVEQGEGPRGHWRKAHFGQFVAILDEYQQMREANPGFEPARPVMAANVRPNDRADAVPVITDPLTARVTDLFNVDYEILLQLFERFFAHTTETDAQLKVLADASVALMVQVIKPLGGLITTLPPGPAYPARTAGPSFELFYESDYLMPHQQRPGRCWPNGSTKRPGCAASCALGAGTAIAARLEPVLGAIRQIAASLPAHLDAGTPAGRPGVGRGPRLLAADIDALAIAATRILDGLPAGPQTSAEAPPAANCSARPAPSRAPAAAAAAGDPEAAAAAGRLRPGRAGGDPPAAGLRRSAACPPELAEAVAALQDVLLRVAPPSQERPGATISGRRSPPWPSLDPGRPQRPLPGHERAHGPQPPGHRHQPAPQLALCRCGESAVKPACDGTCHANGFSDAKDPARVPDHRDTYPGQQVTVFDNRGICQHSGFCTDRLPDCFPHR